MLIRPLNFTQNDLSATSDKNTNFNISKTLQSSSLFSKDKLKHGLTYTKPVIRLPRACHGRTVVWLQANSSHMCCLELALDRQLCTHFGSKRFLRWSFSPFINPTALSRWWALLRTKQLTLLPARYGCAHEALDRRWVGVCVPLSLNLHYFQCNQIKFNLFFINYCIS